jgi:hypothetical protein
VVYGLGWDRPPKLNLPEGVYVSAGRLRRLKEAPAIVSAVGWPAQAKFSAGDEPDWWFEMQTAIDVRPDVERGAGAKPPEAIRKKIEEAAQLRPGIARAKMIAEAHGAAKSASYAPLRAMVMANNVGVIGFERQGDTIKVVHSLLSTSAPNYDEDKPTAWPPARPLGRDAMLKAGDDNTVVVIPLDRPPMRSPALRSATV